MRGIFVGCTRRQGYMRGKRAMVHTRQIHVHATAALKCLLLEREQILIFSRFTSQYSFFFFFSAPLQGSGHPVLSPTKNEPALFCSYAYSGMGTIRVHKGDSSQTCWCLDEFHGTLQSVKYCQACTRACLIVIFN